MDAALTLATAPAVLAIVNLLKGLGLGGKWPALAAVLIAVAINLGVEFLGDQPAFIATASGLILGLSAAGLYDMTGANRNELDSAGLANIS